MLPDIGQIVLYALTEEQAEEITRRRRESGGRRPGSPPRLEFFFPYYC